MKKLVSLKNVNWQKGERTILNAINWEILYREQWAVLGLNGSGKSSLLNIVCGYQFPTKGEVEVLGERFGKTNIPELRKKIGIVSHSLSRFDDVLKKETVEEIIVSGKFASIGLYEQVRREDWDTAESFMEKFRISYLKGKTYQSLSQGEKMRVMIARAFMANPEILILDEPCSGLDLRSREELLDTIQENIVEKKLHLIYVTHHIEEMIQAISHVLVLKNGRAIASGPKRDVLTDDLLSEAFSIPVHVQWEDGRPWLTVKRKQYQ
jgi:iron complex transport system ATP-binding protein